MTLVVDGLIGRDHHEALDAVLLAEVDQILRAEDVIMHRLDAVLFHQRNVLVRGGVDDDLRVIALKNAHQGRLLRDGADLDLKVQLAVIRGQEFLLHVVRAVFINIENDNLFWFHLGQLPAELGADGAAAARDENDLIAVIRAGLFVRDMDRLAEQQIFYIELTQMALFVRRSA